MSSAFPPLKVRELLIEVLYVAGCLDRMYAASTNNEESSFGHVGVACSLVALAC